MSYIEVSMCGLRTFPDGSLGALEHHGERAEEFSVFAMERDDNGHIANDPFYDEEFATREEAEAAFAKLVARHPGCDENVFSMPHPGLEGEA